MDLQASAIKGVIFDLDGTLGETLPVCLEAFRRAASPLVGRNYTDEEISATFGPSEEGTVLVLAPDDPDTCLAEYLRHYELLHERCPRPFDGVVELLDRLESGDVVLGMVTGKGPKSAEISLRRLGLDRYFPLIEVGGVGGPCKPAGIRSILAAWSLPGEAVLYVGDSPSDVGSARAAGVWIASAAWADSANADELALLRPDLLFRDVAALSAWLEASGNGDV